MYLLGYDIGSSSVKAALVDVQSGKCVATAFYPKTEAPIISHKPGWAEQDPAAWMEYLTLATKDVLAQTGATDIAVRAGGFRGPRLGLLPLASAQFPRQLHCRQARVGE